VNSVSTIGMVSSRVRWWLPPGPAQCATRTVTAHSAEERYLVAGKVGGVRTKIFFKCNDKHYKVASYKLHANLVYQAVVFLY